MDLRRPLFGSCLAVLAGAAAGCATATATAPFRVHVGNSATAQATTRALAGAARRLRAVECAAVFSAFVDGGGRSLQANLDEAAPSGEGYLALLQFEDGDAERSCRRPRTVLFTAPGSRVVWVCPPFAALQRSDPGFAEATVIHEALHSLGLGEDPPSDLEITEEVIARCGR